MRKGHTRQLDRAQGENQEKNRNQQLGAKADQIAREKDTCGSVSVQCIYQNNGAAGTGPPTGGRRGKTRPRRG